MLLCLEGFIMAKHFCPLPGAHTMSYSLGWDKQGELWAPCSHPTATPSTVIRGRGIKVSFQQCHFTQTLVVLCAAEEYQWLLSWKCSYCELIFHLLL